MGNAAVSGVQHDWQGFAVPSSLLEERETWSMVVKEEKQATHGGRTRTRFEKKNAERQVPTCGCSDTRRVLEERSIASTKATTTTRVAQPTLSSTTLTEPFKEEKEQQEPAAIHTARSAEEKRKRQQQVPTWSEPLQGEREPRLEGERNSTKGRSNVVEKKCDESPTVLSATEATAAATDEDNISKDPKPAAQQGELSSVPPEARRPSSSSNNNIGNNPSPLRLDVQSLQTEQQPFWTGGAQQRKNNNNNNHVHPSPVSVDTRFMIKQVEPPGSSSSDHDPRADNHVVHPVTPSPCKSGGGGGGASAFKRASSPTIARPPHRLEPTTRRGRKKPPSSQSPLSTTTTPDSAEVQRRRLHTRQGDARSEDGNMDMAATAARRRVESPLPRTTPSPAHQQSRSSNNRGVVVASSWRSLESAPASSSLGSPSETTPISIYERLYHKDIHHQRPEPIWSPVKSNLSPAAKLMRRLNYRPPPPLTTTTAPGGREQKSGRGQQQQSHSPRVRGDHECETAAASGESNDPQAAKRQPLDEELME